MERRLESVRTAASKALRSRDIWIIVLVLLVLAAGQMSSAAPFRQARNSLFDLYQNLMPRERKSAPSIIVAIDENSLAKFGQWPWPRSLLAKLVTQIAEQKPAVIGMDIFFPEEDRQSPTRLATLLGDGLSPSLRKELEALPSSDTLFAAAIQAAPVVMGISGEDAADPRWPALRTTRGAVTGDTRSLTAFGGHMQSLPELHDAATGWGLLNLGPGGSDGVARRIPLAANVNGMGVLGLSAEMLRVATQEEVKLSAANWGTRSIKIGDVHSSLQEDGSMWIHFAPHNSHRFVPANALLDETLPASALQGKIVIVAVVGLGLLDYKVTPLGEYITGAEVQAQAVEQMYDGRSLVRGAWTVYAEAISLVLGGAMIAALARFASLRVTLIVLTALVVWAGAVGVVAFQKGVLVDVATPVLGWSLAFAFALSTSLLMARRSREKAVYMFSRFVNPHVVQELLNDESLYEGGQERRITLLFTDIRNFTSLSERQSPAEVVAMLNAYFTAQVEIVFRHKGALDKFIGDAMMVFWGAPLDDPEHALNAVRCALDLAEEALRFREKLGSFGQDFDIGIGIHTGQAVVGLIGSEVRREYTAIGAAVNVASRVEGLTKEARRTVLVTRETVEACGDSEFVFESVGAYPVKGVDRLIEVLEPKRRRST